MHTSTYHVVLLLAPNESQTGIKHAMRGRSNTIASTRSESDHLIGDVRERRTIESDDNGFEI
jgi:hypothetical protein